VRRRELRRDTRTRLTSYHSTAADESHQEQYDSNHQQNPDKVPERVPADHSQQPENDQNNRNGFEHAFVSSARSVALADDVGCNLSTGPAGRVAVVAIACSLVASSPSIAQTFTTAAKLIGGAAVGLALHESAHVVADVASGVAPRVEKVTFGPLPFFAITHNSVSPAREFVISSAGFWTQHAVSEFLLTTRPALKDEQAPVLKGLLAFNVLTSVAYAGAAFARVGPPERDTRGMAVAAGVDEPVIGATILAPAILDTVRYFAVRSPYVVWGSRVAKIAGALLVVKAMR
jgi:hypothetical protein